MCVQTLIHCAPRTIRGLVVTEDTLFTGYEPKCNGSQTFTDEKRSSNADSLRRKSLKKYDVQCNQAQNTPSGRFTKVKERGAVDMRKRKQEQQENDGNVLRKKPEQTTNELRET